jgi:hypothetical protein
MFSLYDKLRNDGYVLPDGGAGEFHPGEDAVVVAAQNVGDYIEEYYSSGWPDWGRVFPTIVSPWPNVFIQDRIRDAHDGGTPAAVGVHVQVRAATTCPPAPPEVRAGWDEVPVRWMMRVTAFGGARNGPGRRFPLSMDIPVLANGSPWIWDGAIADEHMVSEDNTWDNEQVVAFQAEVDESEQEFLDVWEEEHDAQADVFVMQRATLALFTFALLGCKNVSTQVVEPPEKLVRKHAKRGRQMFRFHVLEIESMTGRGGGAARGAAGGAAVLHICRGHFKDYREKGLFGRNKGIYWWDQQMRGSLKNGAVAKDYDVKAPA